MERLVWRRVTGRLACDTIALVKSVLDSTSARLMFELVPAKFSTLPKNSHMPAYRSPPCHNDETLFGQEELADVPTWARFQN